MNSIDEKISDMIWPQYARPLSHPKPEALERAKAYLGDKYLLARPINQKRR
jgi:hypothetical protein